MVDTHLACWTMAVVQAHLADQVGLIAFFGGTVRIFATTRSTLFLGEVADIAWIAVRILRTDTTLVLHTSLTGLTILIFSTVGGFAALVDTKLALTAFLIVSTIRTNILFAQLSCGTIGDLNTTTSALLGQAFLVALAFLITATAAATSFGLRVADQTLSTIRILRAIRTCVLLTNFTILAVVTGSAVGGFTLVSQT